MTVTLAAVENLTVWFPGRARPACEAIDLRLTAGERVLVLGPSGAGKSTLLAALTGIVPRSRDADVTGTVRIEGRDPAAVPLAELSRTLSLLLQDPAAQLALPRVEDELAFVFENRGLAREAIDDAVDRALDRTAALHLRSRRCSRLSGGEQQRVALAAAVATDPQLLLMDEPTALLDPRAARQLWQQLATLRRDDGSQPAMLLVEHRLEELTPLPERLVVLGGDGRLVADGATVEVLAEHAGTLAKRGAWLPLATELRVALGGVVPARERTGALPDAEELLGRPAVDDALQAVASDAPPPRPALRAPVLEAVGASFADGEHTLIHDADLTVRAGEIVAVTGPNGGGKTSLLLGLAGLLPASSGTVTLPDADGHRAAGMVFQHPEQQFLARTVADELALSLQGGPTRARARMRRHAPTRVAVADPRVAATIDRFELERLAGADPFRLSGGQQRRLAVAAMALVNHRVLLLDEPTFGQDRVSSLAIADLLVDLARAGTGIVFATHDLRLAGAIADRVVVVDEGRLVADLPAQEAFCRHGPFDALDLPLPPVLSWWATRPDLPLRALLAGLRARVAAAPPQPVAP